MMDTGRLASEELHYHASILRQLKSMRELGAERDFPWPSLGSEVLADNIDWLDRWIDAKSRSPNHVDFYEREFYPLSNFSAFTLEWFGQHFDTSEAAYHWMKFPPEHEPKTPEMYEKRQRLLWAIQVAPSAHEAFKLAEANKHLRRADWDDVKVDIMRGILRAKAGQHEYVRRKLLETGDRQLIECSWRDDFWGWGANRDGKNMMGTLWMEIRAELRAPQSTGSGDGR
jgi:ribA/ribD-fused uncharacterized protein